MKVRIFTTLLVLCAAGLVVAEEANRAVPEGVVLDVEATPVSATTKAVPRSGTPVPPDAVVPGRHIAPMAKTADGKYYSDGRLVSEVKPDQDPTAPTKDMAVQELQWYNLTYMGLPRFLGIDTAGGNVIMGTSNLDDTLYFVDQDTLATVDTWAFDAGNGSAFGNTVYSGVITNDFSNPSIFRTETAGASWFSWSNPAAIAGRGLDYDWSNATEIWQTYLAESLVRSSVSGTTGTFYDVSHWIPGTMSGLTTFPFEGRTGIAVLCYNYPQIYFFEYDVGGDSLTFLGSRGLPWSGVTTASYGIAYSHDSGLFYYSFYGQSGDYYVSRLAIDLRAIFQSGFEWGHTGDWSCDGQCCGGYTQDCNPSQPCYCWTTTEGDGVCSDDFACDTSLACASSADCRPGFRCVTCSCCGYNMCVRDQCIDGALPAPLGMMTGAGL